MEKWRAFAGVEYDMIWKSAKGERHDHQLFNLQDRSGLITSEKYILGSEQGEVWIKPGLDALGGMLPAVLHEDAVLLFRDAVRLRRSRE